MAKGRGKPGKDLEQLIRALEKAVAGSDKVTVESPKLLADRITGEDREHDVVVTLRGSHHTSVISIECRDRSRKMTVNDVEAFVAKCRDSGIDQGVIVSPKGFSRTALKKAAFHGIRTLTLVKESAFSWLLAPGVVVQNRRVLHTNWTFFLENEPAERPISFALLALDGTETATSTLVAAAFHQFQKIDPAELQVGRGTTSIMFTSPGVNVRDNETGAIFAVERALAKIDYEITEELIPFQLVTYAPAQGGSPIAHAAVADLELGKFKGKFVFKYDPSLGGEILLVKDSDDT